LSEQVFHFQSVHSSAASEDGSLVLLSVDGAKGVCGLAIPAEEAPRAIMLILEAMSKARLNSGANARVLRTVAIREIKILEAPSYDRMLLEIAVDSKAPGLIFDIPQTQLLEFARGILETTGQQTVLRSGLLQ
jgi:hypothetical protein